MEPVVFKPLFHRGEECIGLYFKSHKQINELVKTLPHARWTQTHRCWYVPMQPADCKNASDILGTVCNIDLSQLKVYLQKRKKITKIYQASDRQVLQHRPAIKTFTISEENLTAMEKFVEQLKLKAYSVSTIRTYRNEFMQLLLLLHKKPVHELTAADLRRYMVFAMEKQGIRENTAHSRLNALKFYFEQVLNREHFFWEIPRPKKPQLLPKLLNEVELTRLFNSLANKKHKAMLFTAYSAGLRVSEIINLKIADIDSKRMQIFVRQAKGKKDRYVNLSPVLLDILRKYIKEYKPAPRIYLFESEQTLAAYPARTVQQIFSMAKNKAGIRKEVGIHSLRHSFATHLLDKGTDIKYIKDLLGHFNIKTTERYLHVSKKQLVNIISPFDDLWKNNELAW